MGFVTAFFTVAAFVLLIPVTVFVIECLAALIPERRRPFNPEGRSPRTVVLVPAHNEESGLGATLESLKAAITEEFSILVIADNCRDKTAEVARAA
ncbi:MAG: glycosyltransferase family 2 protein, partial [Myxococcota bacterium]